MQTLYTGTHTFRGVEIYIGHPMTTTFFISNIKKNKKNTIAALFQSQNAGSDGGLLELGLPDSDMKKHRADHGKDICCEQAVT